MSFSKSDTQRHPWKCTDFVTAHFFCLVIKNYLAYNRVSLPCYWICSPWKFTWFSEEKQSAGDRPSIRYCQQYCLHPVLSAASAFCSRCGQGDGLSKPKTGQFWTPFLLNIKSWFGNALFYYLLHIFSNVTVICVPWLIDTWWISAINYLFLQFIFLSFTMWIDLSILLPVHLHLFI